MKKLKQLLATGIACYVCGTYGILYTLPSSTIKLFASENTPLNRIMTETELSIMGSISCASTLIVIPFYGYLLDVLGRKRSIIIIYLTKLLAWILLVTLKRVEGFICAMFLCGLGGCLFFIFPVYINEFCEPSIRGALSSSIITFHGVGTLLSYWIGGTVEYTTMTFIGLSLTATGMVSLLFLKESPLYLMSKGLEKEAAKSIAYYKGLNIDCREIISHLENLRQLITSDITLNDIPEMESLKSETKAAQKKISMLKFLRNSSSSRRALIVLLVLFSTSTLQGMVVVQIYAEPLFAAAVPSMSSTVSSVILALIVVLAGFLQAFLVEAIGRRILLIVSSIVTGLLCLILGVLIQFQWGPGWLTAFFIYIYSITFCFGAGAVPHVLTGEIFLPQIKSFAVTVISASSYLCAFVILFIFNPLYNALGLGPIFYIFAGFCFLTALVTFFCLPETKNLSVEVIQQKFLEHKIF